MGMKNKPMLEKESEETKKEAKLEKEATPDETVDEKILVKKWKGKDWFNILSPSEFGSKLLGQSPATDPKSLIGRNIEFGAPDLTGDGSKYYMKIEVKIKNVEGKTCSTSFNGYECTRDHLLRMVRKRNQKIETVIDVSTKDGWILRMKPWTILNGKPPTKVETKVRHFVVGFLNDFASNSTMNEMMRKVLTTEMQMMLKKAGSKIYPIRFSEVARIKVIKSPDFQAAKPEAAEVKANEPAKAPAKKEKKKPKKEKAESSEEPKENNKKQEAE